MTETKNTPLFDKDTSPPEVMRTTRFLVTFPDDCPIKPWHVCAADFPQFIVERPLCEDYVPDPNKRYRKNITFINDFMTAAIAEWFKTHKTLDFIRFEFLSATGTEEILTVKNAKLLDIYPEHGLTYTPYKDDGEDSPAPVVRFILEYSQTLDDVQIIKGGVR